MIKSITRPGRPSNSVQHATVAYPCGFERSWKRCCLAYRWCGGSKRTTLLTATSAKSVSQKLESTSFEEHHLSRWRSVSYTSSAPLRRRARSEPSQTSAVFGCLSLLAQVRVVTMKITSQKKQLTSSWNDGIKRNLMTMSEIWRCQRRKAKFLPRDFKKWDGLRAGLPSLTSENARTIWSHFSRKKVNISQLTCVYVNTCAFISVTFF